MDKQEFLLLIPGIIYGVAIVDLLKIVQHKYNYWEVILWGILMMVAIINTWIELYQKLNAFVDSNSNFFLIIGQAMIYAQAANVITPDQKDSDTKEYFFKIRKTFFLIIVGTLVMNTIVQFMVFDDQRTWLRLIAIPLFLACALINKIWIRIVVGLYLVILAVIVILGLN